ncbi:MAG TPA: hypothetical protein VHK24_12930 [Steroidobacter sp.]|jgi:hypothetical protein|nr:hypothetical protein [Steroidobacter sp.]
MLQALEHVAVAVRDGHRALSTSARVRTWLARCDLTGERPTPPIRSTHGARGSGVLDHSILDEANAYGAALAL